MRRVHNDAPWSLFSPGDTPYLEGRHGGSFDAIYSAYESDTDTKRNIVDARLLMDAITQCQIDTGEPAVMFKDAVNRTQFIMFHLAEVY